MFILYSTVSALSKLLILCDLFSRRKAELSREERHEIIKYARSRYILSTSGPEVIKPFSFSTDNSAEHEIYPAHKC